ncbi:amino acid permease [Pendulispora brunnea]|uniref:Amino acid permease n=1 Tax=Pendulispora brunnea TaxID=2905690 RepID=A0ABZ2JVC7_9BACT
MHRSELEDERPLGPWHVAAVVIGAMVGVGIFFTPATLARAVPNAAWVLGIWVLGGIASIAGALVFADLGARWPQAGGLYVFLREGFGKPVGSALSFLYGWLQLLVVQPGAMAVIALVLVDHLAFVAGPIGSVARSVGACAAIALFTAANLLGLRVGGRIQIGMAALKLAALAALALVGACWGHASRVFSAGPQTMAPQGTMSSWLLFGIIPVLFTFGGAYHGTFIAGSVRDPERSLPRGIIAAISVVLVAYLGVNVAYLALLGHAGLAASTSPAADAVGIALGPAAGKVLALTIVVSAAGLLNTVCLGFPFVIYAMAKDGVFFERAGRLDPRTGRPTFAVALQGTLACIAVLVGSSRIDVLLTGIAFADATFQAAIAVVRLRAPKSAGMPRYAPPPAAWAFLLIQMGIALGCLLRAPLESAYGACALVVGGFVWLSWRRA